MADVSARGLRFHVQRLGDGSRTVVFLHGLVMDNLSSWYFTVANRVARQPGLAAFLYDLRGHGRSQRPTDGYGVTDMVEDLAAVLDAAEVSAPVSLVGNSFGGLLGVAFALAYPQRTRSLVLVDAHLSDAGWGAEMAHTLGLEGDERDVKIAESFQHWLGRHSERKRNRLAKNAKQLVYGTSLVRDLEASSVFDRAALARLEMPVLALYGETSDIRARGEELARTLPNCELVIVPGCTHSVLWEATDTVRDAVVRFTSEVA